MVCHKVPCMTMRLEKCLAKNVKLKTKSCVIGHCTWLISAMDEHENSRVLPTVKEILDKDRHENPFTDNYPGWIWGVWVSIWVIVYTLTNLASKNFVPVKSNSFGFIHRERLEVWISKASSYTCRETTRVTSVCQSLFVHIWESGQWYKDFSDFMQKHSLQKQPQRIRMNLDFLSARKSPEFWQWETRNVSTQLTQIPRPKLPLSWQRMPQVV